MPELKSKRLGRSRGRGACKSSRSRPRRVGVSVRLSRKFSKDVGQSDDASLAVKYCDIGTCL